MKDNKSITLFINTATKALSLGAIFGTESDSLQLENPKQALETTHLGIKALSLKMGFSLSDVDCFYCLLGPGSNTGIRLGLTIPRTIYAFNDKIRIYGIDTLKLFLMEKKASHAVLSDRNGNLFLATNENDNYHFERIDKNAINEKIPFDIPVIVEREDTQAIEELGSRNLIKISTIDLMMKYKEAFEDYSLKEEEYLPSYTQVL